MFHPDTSAFSFLVFIPEGSLHLAACFVCFSFYLKKKINLESNAARRSKQTKKVLNMKGVKHSFHGGLAERRVSLCMECSKFSDFQVCDSLCFLGEAAIRRIYSIQYNYLVIERHS